MKRRWFGAAKLITVTLIMAGLAEAALRLLYGAGDPLLLRADPDIGYLYRANQEVTRQGNRIRINSFHQRGPEIHQLRSDGQYRVLIIGDSVAFGGSYVDQSETIGSYLASKLAGNFHDLKVVTAAAGSWGIGNEVAYLERFGSVDSQVVVWQIGSHDLHSAKSDGEAVGEHPSMPAEKPLTAIGEVWSRVVWPRIVRPKIQWLLDSYMSPRESNGNDSSVAFEKNFDSFRRGVEIARQEGAKVVVLHTPNRSELTREGDVYARPNEATHDRVSEVTRSALLRDRFLSIASELDVPVVNTVENWSGVPKARRWFRDGVHLSRAGNERVAGLVARRIRELAQP